MTRAEFEQHYEAELEGVDRRYHNLFPLNIRTFEGNGWRYKGYEQHPDRFVFVGSEGRHSGSEQLFRVTVPKDTEAELIWEWDYIRPNVQRGGNTRVATNGPQTQVNQ